MRGFATRAEILGAADTVGWTEAREEEFEDEYAGLRVNSFQT